jgi:hypothetical protein
VMVSALKASGSTWRWRILRAQFAKLLPLPCSRCGGLVEADPPGTPFKRSGWVLGHVGLARVEGANDDHLWPEHRSCSDHSGGVLGAARLAARRRVEAAGPPRLMRDPAGAGPVRGKGGGRPAHVASAVDLGPPGPSRRWS